MPMNRELYPAGWNRIAHSVKESAGWHCEECNRPCRKTGEKLDSFINSSYNDSGWDGQTMLLLSEWNEIVRQAPQRFTLTVAHLDHNPANCEAENLRALCSGCHLRYDADHHAANAADTRLKRMEEAGQIPMGLPQQDQP